MKFNLFRKDTPTKVTRYHALLWNPSESRVYFKPMIDLIRRCHLEIVDMTYYPGGNPMLDNRCMINFGLNGTTQNFKAFERMAYQNPNLKQFMNPFNIES